MDKMLYTIFVSVSVVTFIVEFIHLLLVILYVLKKVDKKIVDLMDWVTIWWLTEWSIWCFIYYLYNIKQSK